MTRDDAAAGAGSIGILIGGLLVLAGLFIALAGRDLEAPGLYYDEVIQAEPAVQFLASDGRPSTIPGIRSSWLFGGWFPLMTQNYMGALKSQLLIPLFAVVDPTPLSLRAATLGVALVGILLAVLFARRSLGLSTALLTGALLACDPSVLYAARHDWGSFALGFALRCGGLALAAAGWRDGRPGRLAAAGVCFGLGLYNKIDFGAFLVAGSLGLAVSAPAVVRAAFASRRAMLAAGGAGFALGAAPLIAALGGALAATRYVFERPGAPTDWAEKLHAGAAVLDGSYFERLMRAGGSFEQMFHVEATPGLFGIAFLAASALLVVRLARVRPLADVDRARLFYLVTAWLSLLLVLVTPRAERVHHFLNAYPFPQLVVASAVVVLWQRGARAVAWRAVAVGLAAAVLGGNVAADLRTAAVIRETGGKGRWSGALGELAAELASRSPGARVVSLDWGFDGPLRFYERSLPLAEPIWTLRRPPEPGAVWRASGGPRDVYLVYPAQYAVFGYGNEFLAAVRALPPEDVEILEHRDRSGDPAFLSIRFARPHELLYRRGFEVRLR